MKKRYKVVVAESIERLEALCSEDMNYDDWIPSGGVVIANGFFHQVMYRKYPSPI